MNSYGTPPRITNHPTEIRGLAAERLYPRLFMCRRAAAEWRLFVERDSSRLPDVRGRQAFSMFGAWRVGRESA